MANDELNLVDQLIQNEKKDKPKKQTKVYKKAYSEGKDDWVGNPGFDANEPQDFWPGDILKLSSEMKNDSLPKDFLLVLTKTPSANTEACVYSPHFCIYGWAESTRAAMLTCIKNVTDYIKNNKEAAQEL